MRQPVHALRPGRASARSGAHALAARIVHALGQTIAHAKESLSRPALNHRVLHRLSVLSDRELVDIGLTRTDVIEAAMPGTGDATHFLVARRDERLDAHRKRRQRV